MNYNKSIGHPSKPGDLKIEKVIFFSFYAAKIMNQLLVYLYSECTHAFQNEK